jgi:hypothetical protein
MNRKKILSKISTVLVIGFLSTSTFPSLIYGQELDTLGSQSLDFGSPITPGSSPSQFSTGRPLFDAPTTDPTITSFSSINDTPASTQDNISSCMSELAADSLLNALGLSVDSIFNNIGGEIFDVVGDVFGSLGSISGIGDLSSIAGSLSSLSSFTDLSSITSSFGIDLGGLTGGIGIPGFGGGGTVPVNEDVIREINAQIQEINTLIKKDSGAESAKEIGNGEASLDAITGCLVNKTIEGILNGTIDWVNSGFNGNPAFIDDPARFFGDIADYEAAAFLDELSGGILCSHIDVQIRVNLAQNYNNQKYRYGRRCTLDDIANNIEGFVSGNFEQGGWDTWLTYTQNPYNNYYGALPTLELDLDNQIAKKQAAAAWEQRNTDFLSIKDPVTGEITTPGELTESTVTKRLNTPIERLTFADEFDELTNSLINQFINISIGELFD